MKIANNVINNILGKPKKDKYSKNYVEPGEEDRCPKCGRIMPWISAMGGYSDICPYCER